MKVLRASLLPPAGAEGVTIVVRDQDIAVPIEDMIDYTASPGALAIYDLFEMPDGDGLTATLEADKRLTDERKWREHNMAVMYYYTTQAWDKLRDGAVQAQTRPSPLSVDELEVVLKQLAVHPDYKHYTILAMAEDFRLVTMRDGEIKVTT